MNTLNVRGIEAGEAERLKRAAHARGLRIGEYLPRLQALADQMRALSARHPAVARALEKLGLDSIEP